MKEEEPIVDPPPSGDHRRPDGWSSWWHWIAVGNPFYPLSAVLVLLGVFLLSGEERMFRSEFAQLIFNFSSVELYGLLIAITAVHLFRRQVYYDTLMLVVLAVLPMLIPFILISQAALLGSGIMTTLCAVAAVVGWIQCVIIRRGAFELPLNHGVSVFVGAVFLLNVFLPIALKTLHAEADAIVWAVSLEQAGFWAWNVALPVLVFGGLFIAPMQRRKFGDCGVGWLPTVSALMLVAGTAVHLWSVGYVYTFDFETELLVPTIWALSWLVWFRRNEWSGALGESSGRFSIMLPVLTGAWVFSFGESPVLFVINLINASVIGVNLYRDSKNTVVRGLMALSLLCVLRALPLEWLAMLSPKTTHLQAVMLVASFLLLIASLFKKSPGWGITAACATVYPMNHFWVDQSADWLMAAQVTLAVWWWHSLRWRLDDVAARVLQTVCVVVWGLHSFAWILGHGAMGELGPTLFALVFLTGAVGRIIKTGGLRYWFVSLLALSIVVLNALEAMLRVLDQIPNGLIILLVGLLMFMAGTAVAKWRRTFLGVKVPQTQ